MAIGHPPLLDTNDRAQAHDPAWQAAQVAARDEAEASEEAAADDEPQPPSDDAEPDPVEVKPRPRGRHEADE